MGIRHQPPLAHGDPSWPPSLALGDEGPLLRRVGKVVPANRGVKREGGNEKEPTVTGNVQDRKSTLQRVIIRRRLGNQIQQVGYEKVKKNNAANNF